MQEHAGPGVRAVHREAVAYAFLAWRTAEGMLRHPYLRRDGSAYERAVGTVLAEVRGIRSVAELVTSYANDDPAVDAAVAAACARAREGPRLFPDVVEGAAFWRRLRELVAEAIG